MAKPVLNSSAAFQKVSDAAAQISCAQFRSMELEQTRFRLSTFSKTNVALRLKASREHMSLVHEIVDDKQKNGALTQTGSDMFSEMKHRFLSFKKDKYMADLEHFKALAKAQAPKFMVIACADSRVCPSSVLGFEPGEAFVIRNVANLVPHYENGPTEVNAALEFAVNSLNVENILVVGHSCCGGIQALMSMEEDGMTSSGFLHSWVAVGKTARLKTKAVASKLTFDLQCRHCEKESINRSLLNLLTYPWIKDKVGKRQLVIHGGYYDFVNCTFEKWSLDHHDEEDTSSLGTQYSIKNREFWG